MDRRNGLNVDKLLNNQCRSPTMG